MTREDRENAIRVIKNYDLNFHKINGLLFKPEEIANAFDCALEALEQEPCEDAISRQAVLEVLKDKWNMFSDANDAMQESIDTIEALSNVTPQESRWIPVSERYPKIEDEYKYFLVTDDKGKVRIQKFLISLGEEPKPYFDGLINVIAWMPLPKAYKVESVE